MFRSATVIAVSWVILAWAGAPLHAQSSISGNSNVPRVLSEVKQTAVTGKASEGQEPVLVTEHRGVLRLLSLGGEPRVHPSHAYVITHGCGGMRQRFLELGAALAAHDPQANIFVVDWSAGAAKSIGGVPNPWAVAGRIKPTGDALATILAELKRLKCLDPANTTCIGESFGNYVNCQAAEVLQRSGHGTTATALAMNPASELGGYRPPVLTSCFRQSTAFVTASLYDTRRKIAHVTLSLETPSDDASAQHTFGIQWLRERVQAGDASWLSVPMILPAPDSTEFDGVVYRDGSVTITGLSVAAASRSRSTTDQ